MADDIHNIPHIRDTDHFELRVLMRLETKLRILTSPKLRILMRLGTNYKVHSHSQHEDRKLFKKYIWDDSIARSYLCNYSRIEIVTLSIIKLWFKEIQS